MCNQPCFPLMIWCSSAKSVESTGQISRQLSTATPLHGLRRRMQLANKGGRVLRCCSTTCDFLRVCMEMSGWGRKTKGHKATKHQPNSGVFCLSCPSTTMVVFVLFYCLLAKQGQGKTDYDFSQSSSNTFVSRTQNRGKRGSERFFGRERERVRVCAWVCVGVCPLPFSCLRLLFLPLLLFIILFIFVFICIFLFLLQSHLCQKLLVVSPIHLREE